MFEKTKAVICIALFSSFPVQAENMTVDQLLQDVIDHYPAIKTAYFQVTKAQQDNLKIKAQLGWQLGAQAGVAKEVSLFGSPVNQTTFGASLGRKLESGDSISLSASVMYEDAETSTIPTLPNPSTTTNLKLEYNKPLGKGADNPDYLLGLINAKAGVDIKIADQRILLDKMAEQVIGLYLAAINTKQRLENTRDSIKRTEKLSQFINSRLKLGIVEEKDQLQTDAQLLNQKAQLSALKLAWAQQSIAINRLMGSDWNTPLQLDAPSLQYKNSTTLINEIQSVQQHSPALMQINSRISIAENNIKLQRQNQKNNLDLKFYLGNKSSEGDTQSAGNIDNSDVVAGIQLDFRQTLDKSGENAALYQAQLERGLQLQNKKQLLEDLHYDLASLIAEIKAIKNSVKAYQESKRAEQKKLNNAEKRYKSGRIDIDQLLQFENQLSATDLALNIQKTELQQRLLKLSLMKGHIWKKIKLPVYDFESDETITGETE